MQEIKVQVPDRIVAQVRAHVHALQQSQREAQARWDALSAAARGDLLRPEVPTEEDVLRAAVVRGTEDIVFTGRYPNTVFGLGVEYDTSSGRQHKCYKKGDIVTATAYIPIGAEVLALVASERDGSNWDVGNLCFGTMNLISPCGGGRVPLSDLTYLTSKDLLSAFDGQQTRVDVTVMVQLVCRTDGAAFDGYRLYLRQEEVFSSIQSRLEEAAGVEPVTFPQERASIRYGLAVATKVSGQRLQDLLRRLNAVMKDSSGVWPDTSCATLTTMTPHAHCIDMVANVQALTAEMFANVRERLLVRLRTAIDDAGVPFVLQPGRACAAEAALVSGRPSR